MFCGRDAVSFTDRGPVFSETGMQFPSVTRMHCFSVAGMQYFSVTGMHCPFVAGMQCPSVKGRSVL